MNPFTNLRIISSYPIFFIVYITFLSFKHMQGVCMSLLIRFIRTSKRNVSRSENEGAALDFISISIFAFLLALISRVSGTFSYFYNPERLGLQVYLIFALTFSLFLSYLSQTSRILVKIVSVLLLFICLLQLTFATQISGYVTGNLSARISNAKDIDQGFIISNEERYLASTLYFLLPEGKKIVVDNRGRFPFDQVNIPMKLRLKVGANPYLWEKGDYIYISRANIVTGISNNSFPIKTPIKYLESNFDRVYVSDNTRVYR